MSNKSAGDVIDRIQIALGVKSDNELSSTLSIGRSTLGGWRSRDSVPYTLCVSLAEEKKLSLDWLLTGEGEMLREKPASHLQAIATPKRRITDREDIAERRAEKMAQMLAQLSEEQQKEMFFIIEKECEFNQLKSQVQELQQRVLSA